MFKILILLITLHYTFSVELSTILPSFPKSCNEYNITPVSDFDVNKSLGAWYEIGSYALNTQITYGCTVRMFSNNDGNGFKLVRKEKNIATGAVKEVEATVTSDNNQSGKFVGKIPGQFELPYQVVAADYTSYLIGWSCIDHGEKNSFQALWVLSKTPTLTDASKAAVSQILTQNGLDATKLSKTVQDEEQCKPVKV